MTGRASVFSDPRIIALINQHFVPVADDCGPLQTGRDDDGKFFQLIAEQGHYAGRTRPTRTRQGLYVATAEGKLLASVNSTGADRVLSMIQRAIEAWKSHPSYPSGAAEPAPAALPAPRHSLYPEGGLVLKMYARDLPRESTAWHDSRVNFDNVWITKDEVKQLVPEGVQVGNRFALPTNLVARLACSHLVDTVRGQCPAWNPAHLQTSEVHLVATSNKDGVVELRLEGHIRLVAAPDHAVNPYSRRAVDQERGIDTRLLGYMAYHREKQTFESFRLIAVGPRWGAYVYNGRANDPGPAPIGFAFEIAKANTATDCTPPMALRSDYFGQ